jgi:hypothetical protein
MKNAITLALMLAVAAPAAAGGKKLSDGLSAAEVGKLERSIKDLEVKFRQTDGAIAHLKKNTDVKSHPQLAPLVSDLIKDHAQVEAFFSNMDGYIKKKDPKLVSYEKQLKGEVEGFKYKLEAVQAQAKREHVDSVVADVGPAVALTVAAIALAVAFDEVWDLAVADVDLVVIPIIDVEHDVVVVEHEVVVEEVVESSDD